MGLVKLSQLDEAPPTSSSISDSDVATAKKDTFINKTAISPTAYPDEYGTLLSYSSGIPVNVEYFKQRVPLINKHSIDTSFSLEKSSVHISYDLIHNLEIRVQDELAIDHDSETTETTVTGEAIMYSGFNPNPGDVFYYKLPDEQIGVFVVNDAVPLSMHRGTHYKINFHMYGYLSEQIDAKIRTSVIEELHFHKQTYFSGEATLLKDVSYQQLMSFIKFKSNAINYLMTHFFNKNEKTIVLPELIFDSFLVEMINQTISVEDTRSEICNLSLNFTDAFDYSIFSALLSQDTTKLLYTGYSLINYQQFVWDSNFSSMDKYRIVNLVDNDLIESTVRTIPVKHLETDEAPRVVSYIFSNRFYYALMRSFEEGKMIDDIVPFLLDMENDTRIFDNLNDSFYSIKDKSYHDLAYYEAHSISTGSNNDLHLPELEFILLDYLINNNIDLNYLKDNVIPQFPFTKMNKTDRLYWTVIFIYLITTSIRRIR